LKSFPGFLALSQGQTKSTWKVQGFSSEKIFFYILNIRFQFVQESAAENAQIRRAFNIWAVSVSSESPSSTESFNSVMWKCGHKDNETESTPPREEFEKNNAFGVAFGVISETSMTDSDNGKMALKLRGGHLWRDSPWKSTDSSNLSAIVLAGWTQAGDLVQLFCAIFVPSPFPLWWTGSLSSHRRMPTAVRNLAFSRP
jgi:hypothetical protein